MVLDLHALMSWEEDAFCGTTLAKWKDWGSKNTYLLQKWH